MKHEICVHRHFQGSKIHPEKGKFFFPFPFPCPFLPVFPISKPLYFPLKLTSTKDVRKIRFKQYINLTKRHRYGCYKARVLTCFDHIDTTFFCHETASNCGVNCGDWKKTRTAKQGTNYLRQPPAKHAQLSTALTTEKWSETLRMQRVYIGVYDQHFQENFKYIKFK